MMGQLMKAKKTEITGKTHAHTHVLMTDLNPDAFQRSSLLSGFHIRAHAC